MYSISSLEPVQGRWHGQSHGRAGRGGEVALWSQHPQPWDAFPKRRASHLQPAQVGTTTAKEMVPGKCTNTAHKGLQPGDFLGLLLMEN